MSTDKVRSTKLTFKGDKPTKKRKREDGGSRSSKKGRRKDDDEDPETWVLPDTPNEIRGPTFIMHPSDPSPICINFSSTTNRIMIYSFDKEKLDEDAETPSLLDRTPTDVSQVWVTTRVAGSPTVNLRTGTGEGKFMSCDAHGLVSADRDARGPQEEWTPVVLPDGMVAFMNVYEKYLGVDEVAGGAMQLRGDSDEVGFRERFWVKIQSKYKKEANEEEKKKEGVTENPRINETSSKYVVRTRARASCLTFHRSQLYQTWGAGRLVTSTEDKKEVHLHSYF
ncbi:hypothetical protein DXG01_016320 [Tephrocybe rancida]|nr:hypothetical protein DXG01_016320 [Tephrocybe rancida]